MTRTFHAWFTATSLELKKSLLWQLEVYAIMLTKVMMGFGFTISTQTCKNISNCLYPNILTHISIFKKAFSPDLGEKNLVAYKLSS